MFMSNFTRSGGRAKFWQSATNLSCCSIDSLTKHLKSMKALAFIALFLFGMGSVLGQTTAERTVFFNRCYDDVPDAPFTIAQVEALFANDCPNGTISVDLETNLSGDNCNWTLVYTYFIKCDGVEVNDLKIDYYGGDRTAPALIGDFPPDQNNLNLCFDEIPAGPTEAEIAAYYADNCGGPVTVIKTGTPTGDNCSWSVTYDYEIYDQCNNKTDAKIEYNGGDTEAPSLIKDAEIPTGDPNMNVCFLNKAEGPTEEEIAALFEDNCSSVITVTKTEYSKGTDCKWMAVYDYTIQDECGNFAAPIQITYQGGDTEAPELFGVPADETVSCIDLIPEPADVTATDNCTEDLGKIDLVEDASQLGTACEGGIFIRTWTATDACGYSTSASQTITVLPAPKAQFDEPVDFTIDCGALANFQAPTLHYSNNVDGGACEISGDAPGTFEPFVGSCGSFVINYEFIDECDYKIEASLTVTVVDNTPPAVTPAVDLTVECDGSGNTAQLNAWLANNGGATATDNCGNVTWSNNFTSLSDLCGATGSATVEFTAVDDCGNDSKTTATFTIVDTTDPVITPAADMTVECDGSGNTAQLNAWLANHGGATASDTCSDVTWSHDFESLSDLCGATGSATVEFTATDDCGRSAKTTATFTIEDTTDPAITPAADMTVECDGSGNTAQLNAWLANHGGATASDTCSDVTWSHNFESLSDLCGATGAATVEFTATDDCGRSAKTTATFTIRDTHSPPITIEAQDLTVECDGEGNLQQLNNWLATHGGAAAYDLCSEVTWSHNFDGLSDLCGATGSATVLFTVTDDCGLSSSTSATFTIQDTTDPIITPASDMTVECDGLGNLQQLNAWLANHGGATASDACSSITWSNNFDGLSDLCGATGAATVEFTATDDCGRSSKTTATFTIQDTTNPSIDNAAEDMTVECDGLGNLQQLNAWLANNGGAEASDGCSNVTWSNDFTGLSDLCGATGSALVVFIAADECGRTSKTSATFTIEDTTPPAIDTPAADLTVECDGAGNTAQLNAWLNSYGGASASDSCGDVTWSHNFNGLSDLCGATGAATVEFTATDSCGLTSKTTATFTIEDTTDPVIGTQASDMTVECDGEGNTAQLAAWLANNGGATAYDSCGDVTWSNSCSGNGQGATEFVGTFSTHDGPNWQSEPGQPVLTGQEAAALLFGGVPSDYRISTDADPNNITNTSWASTLGEGCFIVAHDFSKDTNGEGYTNPMPWVTDTATSAYCNDNCGGYNPINYVYRVTGGQALCELSDECGATGSVTVEFTATDSCGRTSKTTATFTIEDTTDPVIDTPASDETVECDGAGNLDQLNAWLESHGGASASDTCSSIVWSHNFDGLSDLCGATGAATVEFTATDECGRSSKTTATFTIEDTTDPVFEVEAMDMTVECDGAGNLDQLNAWLESHGGALAFDGCSGVTWSHNFDALSDLCGATGAATVEFTATDDCGRSAKTTATFTIEDTTDPVFTSVPADLLLECDQTAPDVNATAEDTCGSATVTYADYYEHTPWTPIVDGGDGSVDLSALPNGFTTTSSNTGSENSYIAVATTMVKSVNLSFDINFTTGDPGFEALIYVLNGTEVILATSNASGSVSVDLAPGDQFSIGVRTADDLFGNSVAVISNIVFTPIPLECPLTDCFIREFTAVDECGNTSIAHQIIRFQDTTAPVVVPAADLTVECDGDGNTAQLQAWLDSHGGATATDNCSDVTWSNDFEALSDLCGETGSATVTFTATDACNNAASTTATFTIEDTTDPVIDTQASDMTVECDGEGNTAQLAAWLANNGGATAYDSCGDVTWSNSCSGNGQGATEFVGTFSTHDGPNWQSEPGQPVLTGQEAAALLFGGVPSDYRISTDADPNNITNTSWASTLGEGCFIVAHDFSKDTNGEGYTNPMPWVTDTATSAYCNDNCGGYNPINYVYRVTGGQALCELSDECGATGSVTVEFTATDSCGRTSKTTATFTIEDTTDPVIDTPASDETVECDGAGNLDQLNAWLESHGGASASDTCSSIVWSHNFDGLSDLCGATGAATVEFTATDECGRSSKTTATFTIQDTTDPVIDTPAANLIVECDGSGNTAELNAWLDSHGGASASDDCSGITWSHNFTELSDLCGATGAATVEFTATDDCGRTAKTTATFTIEDNTAPVLTGVIPSGQSNVNACFDDMPMGPSEIEMAALYYEACGAVVVTKTSKPLGDNCSWAVLHRYEIADECGNSLPPVKIYYNGGDYTAPELISEGSLPQGQLNMEACYDAIPEAPKDSDIAALFADNCGGPVTVVGTESVTGNNCAWEAVYTYTVKDACNNYAPNVVVRYTGGDHTAPVLTGTIPMGQNSLNLCLSEAPVGPSIQDIASQYTDNCGDVIVTKTPQTWGDDCSWIRLYVYTIKDACNNYADEVKVYYNGGDQSAPVLSEQCVNETMIYTTEDGADCPAVAGTSLTVGQVIGRDTEWDVANIKGTLPNCFTDNCAAPEELTYTVDSIEIEPQDSCSTIITIKFDVEDNCENIYRGFECIFIIVDDTAPVVECPEGEDFGTDPTMSNGVPVGVADKANYTDNCQADGMTSTFTDELSSVYNAGNQGGVFTIECYVAQGDLFDYVDYVVTGTDGNGLPTYTGTLRINGASGYPLYFNQTTNRWEGYSLGGQTLNWYSDTLSCDIADWTNNNTTICTAIAIDCSQFGSSPSEDFTLVRTFTHDDGCGNVGECSVTYTWSETAGDVICGYSITGNTANDGVVNTVPFCGTTLSTAKGIYYTYIGTGDITTISTCSANTTYDTKLGVFTDSGATCVVGNDDQFSCGHSIRHSEVTFASVDGQEYQIYVTGFGTATGDFELSVACEEPAAPTVVECGGPGESVSVDNYPNNESLAWAYTSSTGDPLTVNFSGLTEAGYDIITVYDGVNDDAPVLGTFSGDLTGDSVTSTNDSIFIVFESDNTVSGFSFDVNVACGQTPPPVQARSDEEVVIDFKAYPVPFDNEVTISYSFEFETNVVIELYDTKGLLILSAENNNYKAGSSDRTKFDLSRTSNQMFYVKLTTSQGSVTKKIVSSSPNRR